MIVVAVPMDYELIQTVPSALGSTATGLGYSHDAALLIALTQYIRGLGYEAIGSLNDTAISIPYADQSRTGGSWSKWLTDHERIRPPRAFRQGVHQYAVGT